MVKTPSSEIRHESNARSEAELPLASSMPSLAALIVLAVGFRLPPLFLLRYGGSVPDWSDFRYYVDLAGLSAQGYFPDIHFWVEYPPLFPWLAVGAYQLSLLIPGWIHPYFWFYLILSLVMALADAGSIVLVDHLGDAFWGKPAGRRSATIYAALFLPTFAILGWFDTLPTFFLLLAIHAIVAWRDRSPGRAFFFSAVVAGAAIGIGAMLKLFPVLALPASTLIRPRSGGQTSPDEPDRLGRRHTRFTGVFVSPIATVATTVLTIGLIALPFLLRSRETFLATFRNILARGSWMSPWAILDGNYGTGGVASLHDRLFYNASASWGQPSHYAALWWAAVALCGGLFIWRWWVARQIGTARAAIAFTGFAVSLLLLLSRGFSQQFTVWLLPFVAIVLPGVGGALLAVLLTLNDIVLEGYLYVTLFPTLHHLLWISTSVRTVLLIWFAVECAVAVNPKAYDRFGVVRRRLVAPAVGAAVLVVVIGLVMAAPDLQSAMLARTGDDAIVAAVQKTDPSTALVFTQPEVFDRLAGDVRPRASLLVAEPGLLTWTGDRSLYHRLETGLAERATVILVNDANQPASPLLPAVRTWLSARYGESAEVKAASTVLEEYSRDRVAAARAVGVQFGEAISLIAVRPSNPSGQPGSPLAVTLEWRADKTPGRDYTVSLQLLDAQGKLVAQHDAMPVDNTLPTTTWRPGQSIADPITLSLPSTLAPGTYQLIVVLYDHQTLQRLPGHGAGQSGDHATLGAVKIG